MPNHVTTRLTASREVLDHLFVDGQVDFNSVIPMPDEDDPIFTATKHNLGVGRVGYSWDGYSPLNWANANWGTKWNAYSIEDGEESLKFDTAWAHPFPVIEALSRQFPDETLLVEYADEDLGSNRGQYEIRNGEVIKEREFGGYKDPDALDFAARIKYGKSYAELMEERGED